MGRLQRILRLLGDVLAPFGARKPEIIKKKTHWFFKVSEGSQERLGASWVRLGACFERLGGALGRLGRDLGASWARLGASWGSETRNHQKPIGFLRSPGARNSKDPDWPAGWGVPGRGRGGVK